ncbi:EF hand [Sphingomonas guangdongensis]|uniref:EF hand n=1 Tax=Sphingomonas guangdongensis TaxID=1141890 RepID=A0A285R0B8_9SPHN|nr:EF-hand domain-containing protein [Sphingomonas guangdongensis]SOB87573.1 EF hand [Sphingomonas guangdongensis]
MLKYLAGVASALLLVAAGVFLFRSSATAEAPALVPRATAPQAGTPSEPLADEPLPEAAALTREQRRFNRYDKDRDAAIAREEYLQSRRKAYAKLDANGDGRLSFDEWAAKTVAKFTTADRDRSGSLTAAEFATTAVKRSPARARRCPPQQAPNEAD